MISVIDIGLGNITNVSNALKKLKCPHTITCDKEKIKSSEKIIFPGVGNFSYASKRLDELNMKTFIHDLVTCEKKPILGICLGMQLLFTEGLEGEQGQKRDKSIAYSGLNLIKGTVKPIKKISKEFLIPHVGWNDVKVKKDEVKLFKEINGVAPFYFVHSYCAELAEKITVGTTNHGIEIVSYVEKNNIYGAQFHPEKSQKNGLQLLRNFIQYA